MLRSTIPETLDESGFSLLELILSLVLLAFLSAGLISSLQLGLRAWERTTQDRPDQQQVYFAQKALRHFLGSARAVPTDAKRPQGPIVFDGAGSALQFITQMPPQFGFGGDYYVAIGVRAQPSGRKDLVLGVSAYFPGAFPQQKADETTVVENVSSVGLRYFDVAEPRNAPEWREVWKDRTLLPALVSVDVAFPQGDQRLWPTLVVAPQRQGSLLP